MFGLVTDTKGAPANTSQRAESSSGSNEPHRVFVARDGRHELTRTILTAAEMRDLVERMPKSSGRRVDLSTPFVDAMLACCSRRLDDFSSPDQRDRDVDTASGAQQTAVSAAGATARR